MANHLALSLDRSGHAEMSCIAGVGGEVPPLVRIAKSGRKIVAIDGCELHCVSSCLGRHGVKPNLHVTLTRMGIRKRSRMDFSEDEAAEVFREIVGTLLSGGNPGLETSVRVETNG